jgi:hypothetical protein
MPLSNLIRDTTLAHPVVAAVSDRRRRSEIDATFYVPPYSSHCVADFDKYYTTKVSAEEGWTEGRLQRRVKSAKV